MTAITIRRARRADVERIVTMLADDALGRARERIETPLPASYVQAFARLDADPNITLMVAEEGGLVIGCLAAVHPAGFELARRIARADRGCSRRQRLPQPRHRRAAGALGGS